MRGDDILVRLRRRVMIDPQTGCWLFKGSTHKDGYGLIRVGPVVRKAHQVAYEAMSGPVPAGTELDHLCRRPACCNPSHLEPVSHRENVRRGARTKLTAAQVAQIKGRPDAAPRALAAEFGVSVGTIKAIRLGACWRDIEPIWPVEDEDRSAA